MPSTPKSQRLAALQSVTSALTGAVTPAEVAGVVLERGISLLGARAGSVYVLGDGDRLRRLRARGVSEEMLRAFADIPLAAPLPMAEVVRTRRAATSATAG